MIEIHDILNLWLGSRYSGVAFYISDPVFLLADAGRLSRLALRARAACILRTFMVLPKFSTRNQDLWCAAFRPLFVIERNRAKTIHFCWKPNTTLPDHHPFSLTTNTLPPTHLLHPSSIYSLPLHFRHLDHRSFINTINFSSIKYQIPSNLIIKNG